MTFSVCISCARALLLAGHVVAVWASFSSPWKFIVVVWMQKYRSVVSIEDNSGPSCRKIALLKHVIWAEGTITERSTALQLYMARDVYLEWSRYLACKFERKVHKHYNVAPMNGKVFFQVKRGRCVCYFMVTWDYSRRCFLGNLLVCCQFCDITFGNGRGNTKINVQSRASTSIFFWNDDSVPRLLYGRGHSFR